ncbi:ABC transporter substrate-binding protein [Cohnella rhizosphaerae]|uniref:ABC transporter substrate-binding protein n=1 Tax=Cohnella rhizosphaerae TaxID=1457232 RepID=A0A9X4QSR0_9BACL|nr:ABC transporter substrate-binding protein [Cohnella rhizosphaerae]MDG0808842.1 ABC transporter substrate-binding protein [Cohnella rhizosphaerae]
MLKKALSLSVASVLLASSLAGCAKNESGGSAAGSGSPSGASASASSSEAPYTVNFAYHAPKEGNQAEVNELINQLTMKDLNMKVKLIPITWDTYNSKMSLMLAAGEPIDISFAFAFSLPSFIDQGYIVDASKYAEYTKDIYEVMGDDVEAGHIGDMLAGFPMMNVRATPSGIFVRKDIFEALGHKASDFTVTTDDMSSFDQLTKLFAEVKAKYPDMTPFDGFRTFGLNTITYVDGLGDNFGVLENYGQTTKITNWYESEQFKKFAELNREWFTKGYASKDIAVDKELGQAKMKAGKTFAFFASYGANALTDVKSQTGYDTVLIPVSSKMKSTTAVNGALNVVLNSSADKAKAFQFLNWAYKSKEFNDLLNWGVPDKDWVVNKDGQADYPEGVTAATVNYHSDYGFIYPNQYLMTPWAGSPADIWDRYKKFDADALVSKAYGFTFDSSSVATEESQLAAVLAKYENSVSFGSVDPAKMLPKMNKELYDAGLQEVMDAKQKQLDDWLAKQK